MSDGKVSSPQEVAYSLGITHPLTKPKIAKVVAALNPSDKAKARALNILWFMSLERNKQPYRRRPPRWRPDVGLLTSCSYARLRGRRYCGLTVITLILLWRKQYLEIMNTAQHT